MILKDGDIRRYIGGGKVFAIMKDKAEIELGECQNCAIEIKAETADAFNRDKSIKKLSARVVTGITGNISLTIQNISPENMAMALLGKVEDMVISSGAKLPDGTTATAETTLKRIRAGKNPIIECGFKFVGDDDGDEKPIVIVYKTHVTPTGKLSTYQTSFKRLNSVAKF